MLRTESLHVRAGSYTFTGIDVFVGSGECHVIVGPTGAGKTLLLESIVGFVKPLQGRIFLGEREISKEPVEKRGIAYVPQDLAIFPHLTVEENVFYGPRMKKRVEELRPQLMDLVDVVGINKLLPRRVGNLSGGELQRVALVRALASGSRTILLDEPLSSLHESLKRELWFLLKELQAKLSLSILMVTHDLEEAYFLGDKVSILLQGRIEQTGTKKEIYYSPQTREAAAFVGIRNFFDFRVKEIGSRDVVCFCEKLGKSFVISGMEKLGSIALNIGDRVVACIRSESVMVLREGYYRENQDNLLNGKIVHTFEKGQSHTLILKAENSSQLIEIEIADFAIKKMGLFSGKEVTVSLKSESLFLLKPEDRE